MLNLQGTLQFVSPSPPLSTPPRGSPSSVKSSALSCLSSLPAFVSMCGVGGRVFRALPIGPRWWGNRVEAGHGLRGQKGLHLWAGASLRARSRSTRRYTMRQRAHGWRLQEVWATRRSMALTSPAAARPSCSAHRGRAPTSA